MAMPIDLFQPESPDGFLTAAPASPADLLTAAYEKLGFDQGELRPAATEPSASELNDWVDKGDWQTLAAQVGAERIFFVEREPVVVFARTGDNAPASLHALYKQIWCMSRPQLLFLASPGQLSVYDLTKAPPRREEAIGASRRLISVANSIAEVQSKLADFHRERIESGAVFGDERFADSANRSDRALIRDLKTLRHQLAAVTWGQDTKRPELRHFHSVIGRAIFIRYLEDREILLPSYFESVAAQHEEWGRILAQEPTSPAIEPRLLNNRFLRVLQNKEFTYALFDQMAVDFNGDTFPIDDEERERIQQEHLDSLRGFLLGNTTQQEELFFFAYRFEVIPIELISTIYEEFYNEREGKDRNQGSHYTPPTLVEFVLAQVLTPAVLAERPRVIDPACGSGIFLVETFRRMVRHLWAEQNGKRVGRPQLRKILRDQIAGLDINEEAVRVAAFSLYLAYLHYQSPREINAERRLPHLKWVSHDERQRREKKAPGAQFFDILHHANSFEVIAGNCPEGVTRRFGAGSAAVVVGNPPWGYPKKDDIDGHQAMAATKDWCKEDKGRPVGDNELSQAFIHLTLALLCEGGRAGLLVSSGVLFKHHDKSRAFRRTWLQSARLEHVVNFAHVRHIFFSGPQRASNGISPFISVVFKKERPNLQKEEIRFEYWSAKRTASVKNRQAVVLNRGDMHWLSQRECLENEKLWKIYWWGGHRDEALIRALERFPKLLDLPKLHEGIEVFFGQGFKEANRKLDADWLENYAELRSEFLQRYGPFDPKRLVAVPKKVERRGVEEVYDGHRLLVGRGIKAGGFITSRIETSKFCFRNSINGVRLKGLEPWQEAVVTAIFWSSLSRYYFFTTIGSWGFWHDEIHLEHVQDMPICFPENAELRNRITTVVGQLQSLNLDPDGFFLSPTNDQHRLPELELDLNEAIFELYQLSVGEKDLVRDMCAVGLDLFYRNQHSDALREVQQPTMRAGTIADLQNTEEGLAAYLLTFLAIWNSELGADSEFVWRLLSPSSRAPLLAISFTTHYKNQPIGTNIGDNDEAWRAALSKLNGASLTTTHSASVFVDSFFRYVSEREFLFIKRNERRFWTRTAAREDAESALTNLMIADGARGEN
jgi:N-6 DNA Methylase